MLLVTGKGFKMARGGKETGFRFKVKASSKTNYQRKFFKQALKTIEEREIRAKEKGKERAGDVIEKHLRKNTVIRSLLGANAGEGSGKDLQAEFGLKTDVATQAVEKLIKILREKVYIKRLKKEIYKSKTGARLEFEVSGLSSRSYQEDLLMGSYPFSYISTGHSYTQLHASKVNKRSYKINWMKWLVQANRGISNIVNDLPDIKQFGITYDINKRDFSRSGRALMIRGTIIGGASLSSSKFEEGDTGKVILRIKPPKNRKFAEKIVFIQKRSRAKIIKEKVKKEFDPEAELIKAVNAFKTVKNRDPGLDEYQEIKRHIKFMKKKEVLNIKKAEIEKPTISSKKKTGGRRRKKKVVDFPYSFPEIAKPKRSGKNFIADLTLDSEFKKEIKERVSVIIKRIMLKGS